jgi:delta1-piperideine-2-carboxylate reductase
MCQDLSQVNQEEPAMGKTVRLSIEEIERLANVYLRANGCDEANAAAVSRTLAAAERDGAASHGLFRLDGYIASLKSGKVNGKADPTVRTIAPGVLRVDGDAGFAPLALERSREPLIDLTRRQGVALCGLVNIHHFAALWMEVEPLAAAGLCAMAMTAYKPSVAPAGAAKPFFGTNPVAFGWPRRNGPPMVFDQASAAMARGEVMLAARDGKTLPPGVGLDRNGAATIDPKAILDGGVLLPFGGYKGSAIAMMVELLASALIGERFSYEAGGADNNDGGPPRGGEFLLAIDPARCGDADGWLAHSEQFFERMTAIDGVRLPGDRRYARRGSADGADVPEEILAKLRSAAP